MRKTVFLLAIAFVFSAIGLRANADTTLSSKCGTSTDDSHFFYCIHETAGSKSTDVIYFLHGAASGPVTESSLLADPNYSAQFKAIRAYWKAHKIQAPRIIEISFGGIWLLVPKNSAAKSGLLEKFVQTAMPATEALLTTPKVSRRVLWGHSMGGLNAAFLASLEPSFFAKVAMNAPAFFDLSPFASPAEIAAYAKSLNLSTDSIQHLVNICLAFVATPQDWDQVQPDALASKMAPSKVEIYLSAGDKDVEFFGADQEFALAAQKSGARIDWRVIPGGNHNSADVDSLAGFLTSP